MEHPVEDCGLQEIQEMTITSLLFLIPFCLLRQIEEQSSKLSYLYLCTVIYYSNYRYASDKKKFKASCSCIYFYSQRLTPLFSHQVKRQGSTQRKSVVEARRESIFAPPRKSQRRPTGMICRTPAPHGSARRLAVVAGVPEQPTERT